MEGVATFAGDQPPRVEQLGCPDRFHGFEPRGVHIADDLARPGLLPGERMALGAEEIDVAGVREPDVELQVLLLVDEGERQGKIAFFFRFQLRDDGVLPRRQAAHLVVARRIGLNPPAIDGDHRAAGQRLGVRNGNLPEHLPAPPRPCRRRRPPGRRRGAVREPGSQQCGNRPEPRGSGKILSLYRHRSLCSTDCGN